MLIRCLLLSVWRKSGPAQFFPSPSTKLMLKNETKLTGWGKNRPGGEKTDWLFFSPGEKLTSQLLPQEKTGGGKKLTVTPGHPRSQATGLLSRY